MRKRTRRRGRAILGELGAAGVLLAFGAWVRGEEIPVLGKQTNPPVAAGEIVPKLTASNATGKAVPIVSPSAKYTVVAFLSTRCPCTARYLSRLQETVKPLKTQGVRLVGINANANEPPEDAVRYAREQHLTFPLLKDDKTNQIARAFGASVTPEVFVLDAKRTVRYHGAIDDSLYGSDIKREYLRDALNALVAGKSPEKASVSAFGCGIYVRKGMKGE